MNTIQIQAAPFFEMLKQRDSSMWDVFAQMISGEPQLLVFTDEAGDEVFSYTLPENLEKLDADRKIFAEQFNAKIAQN